MGFFEKRGQLTSFILVGIILFIILAVAFYFISINSYKKEADIVSQIQIPFKVEELEQRVDSCLNELSEKAVNSIFFNSGFIDLKNSPIEPLEFSLLGSKDKFRVGWGLFEDRITLISKEGLEFQIKEHLRYEVPNCLKDKMVKIGTKQTNPSVDAKVFGGFVDIKVNYPVVLEVGGLNAKTKDTYEIKLKSNLGEIRNIAEEIVKQQKEHEGQIEIVKILSYGYDVKLLPLDEKTSVIMIYDKGTGLIFMFGSRI